MPVVPLLSTQPGFKDQCGPALMPFLTCDLEHPQPLLRSVPPDCALRMSGTRGPESTATGLGQMWVHWQGPVAWFRKSLYQGDSSFPAAEGRGRMGCFGIL